MGIFGRNKQDSRERSAEKAARDFRTGKISYKEAMHGMMAASQWNKENQSLLNKIADIKAAKAKRRRG